MAIREDDAALSAALPARPELSKTAGGGRLPASADEDACIRAAIFALLESRAAEATVCPSEVARALSPDATAWRALMPRVRGVASRLVADGLLRVTRRGVDVDATARGGPIRLGRPLKA